LPFFLLGIALLVTPPPSIPPSGTKANAEFLMHHFLILGSLVVFKPTHGKILMEGGREGGAQEKREREMHGKREDGKQEN